MEVVPGGSPDQNAASVCSLQSGDTPGARTVHPVALGAGEGADTQRGPGAAGTPVWGGRGLCVTGWLFFNVKRILLEKS